MIQEEAKDSMRHSIISFKIGILKLDVFLIAGSIASVFWIVFNVFDQLLFFSPIIIFYLPPDAVVDFILTNIISYTFRHCCKHEHIRIRHSKLRISIRSFLSGSGLSILSSTCASCSSLGFLLISIFGGAGIATSTFFSNYQIPIRIVSIILLTWALYSISNKLTKSCKINSYRIQK